MNKKTERDDERRFKLFFEYLKRNEQYKKFTLWVKNNFDEEIFDLSEVKKSPYFYKNYLAHWVTFGTVGQKGYRDYRKIKWYTSTHGINLSREIDDIVKQCTDMLGKPFFEKMPANHVISMLKENLYKSPDALYIRIHVDTDYSLKEITEEIKDIVKKEREKRKHQDVRKRKSGLDELQRYLIVYDTRETLVNGKKTRWENVHKQMNPNRKYTEEKRLQLLSDYRKAKSIISDSIECYDPRHFPNKSPIN